MDFAYSRNAVTEKEKKLQRILEIFPGALSWGIITGMCCLSFARPFLAAVIIIAFLLYWLLRLIYMNIFLVLSYRRLAKEKDTQWIKRGDLYHLVIMPVLKEPAQVVEPGILSIKNSKYPSSRILVIVALEEPASNKVKQDMLELQKKYKGFFLDFIVTTHPSGLPGEAAVKGANTTYAARAAAEFFKAKNIAYEDVLVSCFDADTVAQPDYFSCLTYHFMATPDGTRASYQPVPVYHNNIWEVPGFARIIDIGTSFFQLVEATNPGKLVTFSSHSMSFKALVDIGYWPVDMISDDSAIFWKAFIHYDGNYRVVPMYTTVSMDIASGETLPKAFWNIYKQKRRWAWGVENFPFVIRAFLKAKRISMYKKAVHTFKFLDTFVSWATWSFMLSFIIWLPVLFAGREFATTTVYYIVPRIRAAIFGLASVGMIACMVISLLLLPEKESENRFKTVFRHALEWLLIPVVVLALSALPALDAQTRLMAGRYMEFQSMEKFRRKDG